VERVDARPRRDQIAQLRARRREEQALAGHTADDRQQVAADQVGSIRQRALRAEMAALSQYFEEPSQGVAARRRRQVAHHRCQGLCRIAHAGRRAEQVVIRNRWVIRGRQGADNLRSGCACGAQNSARPVGMAQHVAPGLARQPGGLVPLVRPRGRGKADPALVIRRVRLRISLLGRQHVLRHKGHGADVEIGMGTRRPVHQGVRKIHDRLGAATRLRERQRRDVRLCEEAPEIARIRRRERAVDGLVHVTHAYPVAIGTCEGAENALL